MTDLLQEKNESKPFFVCLFPILAFCFDLSNASTTSDIVKLLALFLEKNLKILSASGLLLALQIATIASTICCSISILIKFKLFTKTRPLRYATLLTLLS